MPLPLMVLVIATACDEQAAGPSSEGTSAEARFTSGLTNHPNVAHRSDSSKKYAKIKTV